MAGLFSRAAALAALALLCLAPASAEKVQLGDVPILGPEEALGGEAALIAVTEDAMEPGDGTRSIPGAANGIALCDVLRLSLGGEALAFDPSEDTWYAPLAAGHEAVELSVAEGWRVTRSPMDGEGGIALRVTDGNICLEGTLAVTPLPVLAIETESGDPPGDEREEGQLTLYEADGLGGLRVTRTPLTLWTRGNTSRRFPKKSYRLALTDGRGGQRKLSVAGLREDDDWILNPIYSDTSKLREALSYWLWEEMNRCPQAVSGGFAYAEVLLNGRYWGLYGVQERVDRKQVGANRRLGVLYKVVANDRPGVEELLAWEDDERCRAFELAFAGSEVASPWACAADYVALLSGESAPGGSRLSEVNAVDYALWSALVQAGDNHFKNQFIHCVPEVGGYVLYRVPWDLDHTLGDQWRGDSPRTNYVEYVIAPPTLDDVAAERLAAGDSALARAMAERWAELRGGSITEERLTDRARALFEALYPAILRDTRRWPECGMGEGSAANVRDLEDYFARALTALDAWLGGL